jgi:hypothetical protein
MMLSSRCKDSVTFEGHLQELASVRKAIKKAIEAIQPNNRQLFEVWIHEDESHTAGDQNTWDTCMTKARQADVVLVLYNGNAGWSGASSILGNHVGICHAEFAEAFNKAPGKVRSIQFPPITAEPGSPDETFQRYFTSQNLPGTQVKTGDDAVKAATDLAISALLDLARAGVGVNAQGKYYAGEALQWSRLDFQQRREVTRNAVADFLRSRAGGSTHDSEHTTVVYPVSGQNVAFVCDCIPATLGTAGARELVGQPFLRDHQIVKDLRKSVIGPVHLIACQKSVTESQAIRQLGFPDATVVAAPFGVYVADSVQKIQMVFLANCRDATTTHLRTQGFLQWLSAHGEDKLLASRAKSRRKIADLLALEESG